jgi:hypothetical protein
MSTQGPEFNDAPATAPAASPGAAKPGYGYDLAVPEAKVSPGAAGRAWHVAIHGQKQGPMEHAALIAMMRGKQVPVDSLVWTPGMQQWQPASAFPDFADAMGVQLRVLANPVAGGGGGDDAIATIVPFRNSYALIGYYVSIGSLIPLLGAILGPLAIFFGFKGLKVRRENPAVHGTAHCWVAIILGGLVTLAHLAGIVAIIVSVAGNL